MKNKIFTLVFLPLLISCGAPPKITFEEAIKHLNKVNEKYDNIKNVEHDFEIEIIHHKNDRTVIDSSAFDSELAIHYNRTKIDNAVTTVYSYFEAHEDGKYDFITLVNDGTNKIKHRVPASGDVGVEYFKKSFQNEIKSCLREIGSAMDIAKESGVYRALHDNDLKFEFNSKTNSYQADIYRGQIKRYYSANKNDNGRVIEDLTYTYSYERFAANVNPNDYIEQVTNYGNN